MSARRPLGVTRQFQPDRRCVCGHMESAHGALPPHPCYIHRSEPKLGECGCYRFVEKV